MRRDAIGLVDGEKDADLLGHLSRIPWVALPILNQGDLRFIVSRNSHPFSLERAKDDFDPARRIFKETHFYGLGQGVYEEVLQNEHGKFLIAPPLGFFKSAHPKDGYAVGGVYFPNDDQESAYVWEYLLKNENRSFSSPSQGRTLSETEDQPERMLFFEPGWYQNKKFTLLGKPIIDRDFQISRSLFSEL